MSHEETQKQEHAIWQSPPPYPGPPNQRSVSLGPSEAVDPKKSSSMHIIGEEQTLWKKLRRTLTAISQSRSSAGDSCKDAGAYSPDKRTALLSTDGLPSTGDPMFRWRGTEYRSGYGWTKPNIPSPRPPVANRFKYHIDCRHYPPEYQAEDKWRDSPWSAQLQLNCDDLEQVLPQHLDWRNNPHMCYEDILVVASDPQQLDLDAYCRSICWGNIPNRADSSPWVVNICIRSRNAQWLAHLQRADIGNLVDLDSAVRVLGFVYLTQDPLERRHLFYAKYLKSWRLGFGGYFLGDYPTPTADVSSLDFIPGVMQVDELRLRQVVDQYIERHIRNPSSMSGLATGLGGN